MSNLLKEDYVNILTLLCDYCENNNLYLLHYEKSVGYGKHLIISESNDLSKLSNNLNKKYVFKREMITDDFFKGHEQIGWLPVFKVDCFGNLGRLKVYSEILVECLWNYDKNLFKKFHLYLQGWSEFTQFQYQDALSYESKKYPDGFADKKIAPYSHNKNLHHLIDLTKDDFRSFFDDRQNILNFISVYANPCKVSPLAILRRLNFEDIGYDENFELAKFIHDFYSKDKGKSFLLKGFSEKIPALKTLMKNIDRESLITEEKDIVIRKLKIKKDDLMTYFMENKLTAFDKVGIVSAVVNTVGYNQLIKDLGVIRISNGNELEFFIESKLELKLKIEDISHIVLSALDMVFKEEKPDNIKQITDLNISKYLLENNLSKNEGVYHNTKKMKI